MKLVKTGKINKLQISKSEWVRIGQNNNWLATTQNKPDESNYREAEVEMTSNVFLKRGMWFEWAEKQQILRAYKRQGAEQFVQTIKNYPQYFPIICTFDENLLKRAYEVIEEQEALNANPNQIAA